jgi:hypothetical protein
VSSDPSSSGRGHIPWGDRNIAGNFSGTARFASLSVLIGYGMLPSLSLPLCLSVSVALSLFLCLCFSLCLSLYLSLFVYRSLSLSVSLSLSLTSNTEASRRDDLESLGYSLIHLLRAGRGLWSDDSNYLEAVNREGSFDVRTTRSKMLQFKLSHTVNELCHDLPSTSVDPLSHSHGLSPVVFPHYFSLVRSLGFYETPNYDYLISLFRSLLVT